MKLFPVALPLQGKPCLVVGGGKIAARRTGGLLECEAAVTVVSPAFHATMLPHLAACTVRRRAFRVTDISGHLLVFVCTDKPEVNERAAQAARQRGIWVNRADCAEDADFHCAAAVRRGSLTIGITTGAAGPPLARHLRRRLEEFIGPEYEQLLDMVDSGDCGLLSRGERWRIILGSPVLDLLRAGQLEEARSLAANLLKP